MSSSSAPSSPPATPAEPVWARVRATSPEAPGVVRLVLEAPLGWTFSPGQVVELVQHPGTEGFFAIASAPGELPELTFILKAEGSPSEPLMHVQVGDLVELRGPLGRGFTLPLSSPPPHLLFLAAGTAIAAVRSALRHALLVHPFDVTPGRFSVLVGVRDVADLCFAAEWHDLTQRGVHVRVAVSGQGSLNKYSFLASGHVQDHLLTFTTADTRAFIAGSEAFEDDLEAALRAAGLGDHQIQRNYRPLRGSCPRQELNL